MDGNDRDRGAQSRDLAGGAEGGMGSGSAGGPSQADAEREKANESDSGGSGGAAPGTAGKVDLGRGSHEQTQGGADPGSGS
jgi:hypothetical protein